MDWKTGYKEIPVRRIVWDEVQEQDFSEGFVLPDYEPEIFRVISCDAEPRVTDYRYSSGRLNYELTVTIRVLYSGDNGTVLGSVCRTVTMNKSADIPEGENIAFYFSPRTDYRNCRAAGKRRLDVRGAVSVRVRGCAESKHKVITSIEDRDSSHKTGIELKTQAVKALSQVKTAVRNITLTEETDLGAGKEEAQTLLRCSASAVQGECSIIAGKAVVRGELEADILYKSVQGNLESMHLTLCPYSQIIDAEDIDEGCTAIAECTVTEFTVKPVSGSKALSCTASLRIVCTICRSAVLQAVTDAYSTKYKCTCKSEPVTVSAEPVPLNQNFPVCCDIAPGENPPKQIHDLRCTVRNLSLEPLAQQGKIRVCGMLSTGILAEDSEGGIYLTEREEAFEELVAVPVKAEEFMIFAQGEAEHCSYHLSAEGGISVKCGVVLKGMLYPQSSVQVLTEAVLSDEKADTAPSSCALRIYYGTEGESVWDIAKRAGTKAQAIIDENELTGEVLRKSGMLLIPIVH